MRLLLLFSLLLSACTTFRVTIHQGNVVQEDKLAQLQPGMTPVQVEYLLGTPMLRSEITPHRWDYLLRITRGEDTLRDRRITVYFADGVVSRIEDTAAPADSPSDPPAEDTAA